MSMPQKKGNGRDGPVRVDFAFRRELAGKVEGNLASFCYQCGACAGDCPAMTYGTGFNPREIMLKVLYGLAGEILVEDSIVWHCTNCYSCHERCPQEVKPVEVIISIKNMLADRGILPAAVMKVIGTFEETGRTVPFSPAIDKTRAKFGLAPLRPVPMEEIRELIRADAAPPGPGSPGGQEDLAPAHPVGKDPATHEGAEDARTSSPAVAASREPEGPGAPEVDRSEQVTQPLPIVRWREKR